MTYATSRDTNIGYALGRRIDARLTLAALATAIESRHPLPGCIHHSDSEYLRGRFPRGDLTRTAIGTAIDASRLIGPAAPGWLDPHTLIDEMSFPGHVGHPGQPV